jgi:hypothetical protein
LPLMQGLWRLRMRSHFKIQEIAAPMPSIAKTVSSGSCNQASLLDRALLKTQETDTNKRALIPRMRQTLAIKSSWTQLWTREGYPEVLLQEGESKLQTLPIIQISMWMETFLKILWTLHRWENFSPRPVKVNLKVKQSGPSLDHY